MISQAFKMTVFLALGLDHIARTVKAFSVSPRPNSVRRDVLLPLEAKATKKKAKTSSAGTGLRGFGSGPAVGSGKKTKDVETDLSKEARAFYNYVERNGAGENLKRTALGFFSLPSGGSLRGITALRDIKKGEDIINIPYELAVNLGPEGEDPTGPGLALLRDYCETMVNPEKDELGRAPYYRMLPPFNGEDCLGSTDFFSDEALEALQSPLIVEETLLRRELTQLRFDKEVSDDFPTWIDGTGVTELHLRWAVWLITSRVLTVQGDQSEGRSYRLLIPFLDMCNHDRSSAHVLTGRAVPGGQLRVVAGSNVNVGEQVNICYGGGVAGNDRFVQDYGFVDSSEEAFAIVAQQLLGKRRVGEGRSAGKIMLQADRERTIEALRTSTADDDEASLATTTDPGIRSAISYRLGVKRALAKLE